MRHEKPVIPLIKPISRLQNLSADLFYGKLRFWGLPMNQSQLKDEYSSHHLPKHIHLIEFHVFTWFTSCSFPPYLTSTLTLPCYSVTSLWDATVYTTVLLAVVTIATPGTGCKYFQQVIKWICSIIYIRIRRNIFRI